MKPFDYKYKCSHLTTQIFPDLFLSKLKMSEVLVGQRLRQEPGEEHWHGATPENTYWIHLPTPVQKADRY